MTLEEMNIAIIALAHDVALIERISSTRKEYKHNYDAYDVTARIWHLLTNVKRLPEISKEKIYNIIDEIGQSTIVVGERLK